MAGIVVAVSAAWLLLMNCCSHVKKIIKFVNKKLQ